MTKPYWVDVKGAGRLAIMPRPTGQDGLADDLRRLRREGVDILVSMLTREEEQMLGLSEEASLAATHGMLFLTHPVPDRTVPASRTETLRLAGALARHVRSGKNVVVHCRMGIGRSSLLAACVLVDLGLRPDEAWARLSEARGFPVPDTEDQKAWI